MFYKYENGYFYAKDDARDGGRSVPYPESYMSAFLSGRPAQIAVIYP